ncbi:helix-turn-helix transcriptional regulator [Pantoea sp. KPR_PJ]|uniref:helix-turn-helix transcriptional regulator n=1 Tax=Pantoea sp. KPR_PJ TaxID=2738375 RepID=UPI0035273AFA
MTRNSELGNFLLSRRARLRPEGEELSPHRRRRTPGLRREEVAAKVGISTEWYTKIEQGRVSKLSERIIASLSKALMLNETELAHLRALTQAQAVNDIGQEIPEALAALVQGLRDPAYVTNKRWDVVIWNRAAAELITDFDALDAEERNIMVFMLTTTEARERFGASWEQEARRMLSLFHADYALNAHDRLFTRLVARFERECAGFSQWWREHEIAAPVSGIKTLTGKDHVTRRYCYSTFISNDAKQLKLALYTPYA